MMHPAGSVHRLRNAHNTNDVQNSISSYNPSVYSAEIDDNLTTTVEDISSTSRGLNFQIRFDYVEQVSVRGRSDPLSVKGTKEAFGRFCKDIGSDGFMLVGPDRGDAAGLVADAIEGDTDAHDQLNIPPASIAKIVEDDSQDSRFKIWQDIDTYTELALIKGALEDSTYSQDFDDQGLPIWAMFDSRSTGRVVGVSRESIVMYGNDVTPSEIESYYFDTVRPQLP